MLTTETFKTICQCRHFFLAFQKLKTSASEEIYPLCLDKFETEETVVLGKSIERDADKSVTAGTVVQEKCRLTHTNQKRYIGM